MGYQISFEGVASTELSHMLRAVERGVNWNGMHLRVQGGFQPAPPSAVLLCPPGQPCVNYPHGPHPIVILLVVVGALAVGGLFGYRLGQSIRAKDLADLKSKSS